METLQSAPPALSRPNEAKFSQLSSEDASDFNARIPYELAQFVYEDPASRAIDTSSSVLKPTIEDDYGRRISGGGDATDLFGSNVTTLERQKHGPISGVLLAGH